MTSALTGIPRLRRLNLHQNPAETDTSKRPARAPLDQRALLRLDHLQEPCNPARLRRARRGAAGRGRSRRFRLCRARGVIEGS